MRKNLDAKAYVYPQPVFIIATYNEEEYKNTIKSVLSKNDGVDDLRRQTLQLSKICSNKMDKIKLSFQFFIGSGIGVCIELAIVLISLY